MNRATHRTSKPAVRPAGRRDSRRPDVHQPSLFDAPPNTAPTTYLTTVYRLRVEPTYDGLATALNLRYLREHGFAPQQRTVGDSPALLLQGVVARQRADWCDALASLTGEEVALGYSNGGAALLLGVDEHVYALTYGTLGRFMVADSAMDPTFGIEFAVRALVPEDIRQVRRRVMGTRGRVDRSLVPGGTHIRMYGIDKWGEIVGQITGRTDNPTLTECRRTGRPMRVTGSDSLQLRLALSPDGLRDDLREVARVCRQASPLADLEFITQIRPVRPADPRLAALTAELDHQLGQVAPTDIGVAVPGHAADAVDQAGSYTIRMPRSGRRRSVYADLELADLLAHSRGVPDGQRWTSLRTGQVTVCADAAGRDEIATAPASRWLTAQLAHGTSQLMLHEGHWYEIGDQHRRFLRDEVDQILSRSSDVHLPPWPLGENERIYNERAAGAGMVLLDRKLLRTAQHHRGIEACDLLGPSDELVHVKRADTSAPLSHLFTQGTVSVDALLHEEDARRALIEMVARQSGRELAPDFRPRKVVYAIALGRGRPVTTATLFTFAQVALYRAVKSLRTEGVEVEVIGIAAT
ncbi:hypothetical protein C1I95_06560 [Micromonospora craterilacus]|uniref:Sporadically distributed protein, TIGR04141 family n=1 Tax=Micromonospora craterilacus TaxID=1655439 RepID=A0A2W2EHJ2_9ACTN|nr:DUF6119 family protein [Micromonospora craterilacus]PZG21803.1 hypothetical protein C1I95_06560 [Micromonospora craterilacus]